MAVNVSGEGALHWDASIGYEEFSKGVEVIINGMKAMAAEAAKAGEAQNDAFISTAEGMSTVAQQATEMQKVFNSFTGTKNKIVELQAELEKLKAPGFADGKSAADLKSFDQYVKQVEGDLKDMQDMANDFAMQLVNLSKTPIAAPVVDTAPVVPLQQITDVIGAQVIDELKKSFGEIDAPTQKFIQDLIELEIKLQDLRVAQADISNAFGEGRISQEQYVEASSFLVAGIADIEKQTVELTEAQKAYDTQLKTGAGSIDEKKGALAQLTQAYNQLSDAQRASPEGQNMVADIAALKNEIKGLEPGRLEAAKVGIVTTRTELTKLTELMARNPTSPMFDTWMAQAAELKATLADVKTSVDQATNSTAGIEAFASGLRGLVGGFAGVTGAMGLFTEDTKQFDEITKNATSALALLNGVQEVSNVLQKSSALNIYLVGVARKLGIVTTAAASVATEVNTVALGANTVALGAQTVGTEAATVAQRSLTVAMLANPAMLIVGAIAALAVAYLALRKETDGTKTSEELLAKATKETGNAYAEKMSKVKPLNEEIKQGNVTQQRSIEIYKELEAIDVKLVAGLKDKSIAYDILNNNVLKYSNSLREQARIEASGAAITASLQTELDLEKQIDDQLEKQAGSFKRLARAQGTTSDFFEQEKLDKLSAALQKQKAVTDSLVKSKVDLTKAGDDAAEKGPRTIAVIDAEIAAIQKRKQTQNSETAANIADSKKIMELEAEKAKLDPNLKAEKKAGITAQKKEQRDYNQLLEEQKNLLASIDNLKRDAYQSGLTKELSELDRINEKYEKAIKLVEDFNSRAPKDLQVDTTGLKTAQKLETQNQLYKDDAKAYIKALGEKEQAYNDYEAAKTEFGIEKAQELYGAQVKGADSYLDYLKKQKAEIDQDVTVGPSPEKDIARQLKSDALTKQIAEETEKQRKAAMDKQLEDYRTLLAAAVTYEEAKLSINKKYDALEVTLQSDTTVSAQVRAEKKKILEQGRKDELTAVENDLTRNSELYKQFNADLVNYTKAMLEERVKMFEKALEDNKKLKDDDPRKFSPETIQSIEQAISRTKALLTPAQQAQKEFNKLFEILKGIGQLGAGISDLGKAVKSDFLSGMGDAISGMASQLGNLQVALDKSSTDAQKQAAGIQAGVALVSMVIDAAAKRKRDAEAYYASVIGLQQEYNLSLNDQLLMQSELKASVFINDYEGQMLDGIKAAHDASRHYEEALAKLTEGQAKVGQKNGINWGAVGSGAAAGAAIGTAVPVIGTAIGAAIGAAIGLVFGTKKKDVYTALLGEYPELILKAADGTEKFNAELAKSLVSANMVDDATKLILNNIIEWDEQLKKAHEQIKAVVSDLAGALGDELRNSLVSAFEDGTSSAEAFGDSVNKVLENILSNLLFNQVFSKSFEQLQDRMEKSFDMGGDNSWVDDIATFFEGAPDLIEQFNSALADANAESVKRGLNVFAKTAGTANDNSLQGAIKGISQQQADLLAGQFGGLRITAFDQLTVAKSSLNQLTVIARNTGLLIDMEAYLRKFSTTGIKVI